MSYRTALCTTAALLLAAAAASASGASPGSRPAPSQAEEMKVSEEVGFVFEVDLGAVPGATYVEGLPGETTTAPLRAAADQEDEAPAEEPAGESDGVLVEDVVIVDEPDGGEAAEGQEEPAEEQPEEGADGGYVEMEEVAAPEEAAPEEGDSPAGADEVEAEPSGEPAGEPSQDEERWEEETPPAADEVDGAAGEPETAAGDEPAPSPAS